MEKQGWKTLAVVIITLFVLENLFISWAMVSSYQDGVKLNECYYDICSDYPEATLESNVCFCYDLDMLGEYKIAKTEIIK